jgi:hypothetical protein
MPEEGEREAGLGKKREKEAPPPMMAVWQAKAFVKGREEEAKEGSMIKRSERKEKKEALGLPSGEA